MLIYLRDIDLFNLPCLLSLWQLVSRLDYKFDNNICHAPTDRNHLIFTNLTYVCDSSCYIYVNIRFPAYIYFIAIGFSNGKPYCTRTDLVTFSTEVKLSLLGWLRAQKKPKDLPQSKRIYRIQIYRCGYAI